MDRLTLELKGASFDDATGRLTGYANVKGNIDRANEVVDEGAYIDLGETVKAGFGAHSHDWNFAEQIGTIESLTEDAMGLKFDLWFHSTARAQECRTIVKERIERGKAVSLSIGYQVLSDEMQDGVRHLKGLKVYEISLVTVPANPLAMVTGVKGADDAPFADFVESLADALSTLTRRTKARMDLRAKEGRTLSRINRDKLGGCLDRMKEACDHLEGLLSDTEPPAKSADPEPDHADRLAALQARMIEMRARELGLVR